VVTSPVPGFTGDVAGVKFAGGEAQCGDGPALAYLRSAGYSIQAVEIAGEPPKRPSRAAASKTTPTEQETSL